MNLKTILFVSMLLTSVSSQAFVPKSTFTTDAYLTDKFVYLKDKENNRWKLKADCLFDLRPSDKPEIIVYSRAIREGARLTIRNGKDNKSCRIESLVKL